MSVPCAQGAASLPAWWQIYFSWRANIGVVPRSEGAVGTTKRGKYRSPYMHFWTWVHLLLVWVESAKAEFKSKGERTERERGGRPAHTRARARVHSYLIHRQKRPGARSVVLTSTATVLTRFLQVLTCFTTGSRVLGSSWPTTAVEARWSTWSSHSCICMQRYRLQHLVFPHHLSRQSSVVMQASFHAWRVTCANLS